MHEKEEFMTVIDRVATIFFSKKKDLVKAIIHSSAVEAGAVGLFTAQIPGDRVDIGGYKSIWLYV